MSSKQWLQFKLLLWKNWLIYFRKKRRVLQIFVGPIITALLLAVLRHLIVPEHYVEPLLYKPFDPLFIPPGRIDTMGDFPIIDKVICAGFVHGGRGLEKVQSVSWNLTNLERLIKSQNFEGEITEFIQKIFEKIDFSNFDLNIDDMKNFIEDSELSAMMESLFEILRKPKTQNYSLGDVLENHKQVIASVLMDLLKQHKPYVQQLLDSFLKNTSGSTKKWIVVFSPAAEPFESIMKEVASLISIIPCGVKSVQAMEKIMLSPFPIPPSELVLAGVDFSLKDTINLNISLRFPGITRFSYNVKTQKVERKNFQKVAFPILWDTAYNFPVVKVPGPSGRAEETGSDPGYFREGFMGLQEAISMSWLKYLNRTAAKGQIPDLKIRMQRFPEPPGVRDQLFILLQLLLSSFLLISFIFIAMNFCKMIVSEKESGLKDVMKAMGMSESVYWLSWFLTGTALMTIASMIIVYCLTCPIFSDSIILKHSNPICVMVYFFGFSISAVCNCLLLCHFLSKASSASVICGLFWAFSLIAFASLDFAMTSRESAKSFWSSFIPNIAFSWGLSTIINLDGLGIGLQWETFATKLPGHNTPSAFETLCFFQIDAFIFITIKIMLCRMQIFHFSRESKRSSLKKSDANEKIYEESFGDCLSYKIQNLRKTFNSTVAVDNLNLNISRNKITVILGHNGAGKTTITSILTGLIKPSSGTVFVDDYDLATSKGLEYLQSNLGLCPQTNVLVESLSPFEHLQFFCGIKGFDGFDQIRESWKYLRILGLGSKLNEPVGTLSGGTRRKLCVGLALCGGSKIVLLDEPTAGMDPGARRRLWTLLQNEKHSRTILLTTHFMDEADVLGDRVAIISEGRLKCSGSPFYLKTKLGSGYQLVMVKNKNCKPEKIGNILNTHLPSATKISNIGCELTFHFPKNSVKLFHNMFHTIELKQKELGIESFGVSSSNLHDVFLRVCRSKVAEQNFLTDKESDSGEKYQNFSLWWNQVLALTRKQWALVLRTPLLHLILIVFPSAHCFLCLWTTQKLEGANDLPPKVLSSKHFVRGVASVYGDSPLVSTYQNLLRGDDNFVLNMTDNTFVNDHILSMAVSNVSLFRQYFMLGASFSDEIIGLFNNNAYHSSATSLVYLYKTVLQHYLNATFDVVNHPLPNTNFMKFLLQGRGSDIGFQLSFHLALSISFVTGWFVIFAVKERVSKFKLLQHMAGVNKLTYWIITFINHLLFSSIINLALVIAIGMMKEQGFTTGAELSRLFVVLMAFFCGVLPWVLFHSFFTDSPANCYLQLITFFITIGTNLLGFVMILRMADVISRETQMLVNWFMSWVPNYSLGVCVINISITHWLLLFCKPIYEKFCSATSDVVNICCKEAEKCPSSGCIKWTENYFDVESPGIGSNLYQFVIMFVTGFGLLLLADYKPWRIFMLSAKRSKLIPIINKDSDVTKEAELIENINSDTLQKYNLVIKDLTKYYGKVAAVTCLNIAVSPGECFGLLGVNGAGKSTTFRILTGELQPTQGAVFIKGLNLQSNQKEVHRLIGYCPQEDSLLEELTGRESLRLFCRLKGIAETCVETTCDNLARQLLFSKQLDMKVHTYSGGTKRKLNTAIALLGDPPVIFLDEPTTGMDPIAKRQFWDVLSRIRNSGKTIILTSHSMEECEALCTRVAIMVKGEVKCLGSVQHLKNKFATGYSLTVKVKGNEKISNVSKFVKETFLNSRVKEEYKNQATFNIPQGIHPWSKMFGLLEEYKKELHIEDYTLEQTTLEQVFLNFSTK